MESYRWDGVTCLLLVKLMVWGWSVYDTAFKVQDDMGRSARGTVQRNGM